MIIPARFNGPPTSGNGGWVAGALAAHVDVGSDVPVQVALLLPPPLDTVLDVVPTSDGVELRHGAAVLARAMPGPALSAPAPPVDAAAAEAGRRHFLEFPDHPFTSCFVCGTARPDGLHVYPGPVEAGDWTQVAAPFAPSAEFVDAPELLWAALDCPGGWAGGLASNPALLVNYTVCVHRRPEAGEPCVLVGHDDGPRGRSGRARAVRSAAYGADGQLLGQADAVWVTPQR